MDVKRLIEDLGGPSKVAAALGKARTSPYRWIERNYITSRTLAQIKDHWPKVNLDEYFDRFE